MQHCGLCFHTTDSSNLNRINTLKQTNVHQCDQCFYIAEPILIYDYAEPCMICYEYSNSKCLFDCSHWICNKCNKNANITNCPSCKQSGKKTIVKKKQSFRYFDDFDITIKKCFKKLYAQINDTVGSQLSQLSQLSQFTSKDLLYHLCVDYHKFLILLADQNNNAAELKLSPPYWIDQIWHNHLLDNESYMTVSITICGYVLYHYPENSFLANTKTYDLRYNATIKLFTEKFGPVNNLIWIKSNQEIKGEKIIAEPVNVPQQISNTETIRIFIKKLSGSTITIDIKNNATILELKTKIDEKEGISPQMQRLTWAGKQLENINTLHDYNITDCSTIHLIPKLSGC